MEWLDIVDENGEPTGERIERTVAHRDGIRHRTAHVWLLRRRGGTVQLLLQKRCRTKDSFPGCYDTSSAGHIPAGDGFLESALRELAEELGVAASADDLIYCGQHTTAYQMTFHGKSFSDSEVVRVFALWLDRDEFDFQPEEIERVDWFTVDEVARMRETGEPKCCFPDWGLRLIREQLNI